MNMQNHPEVINNAKLRAFEVIGIFSMSFTHHTNSYVGAWVELAPRAGASAVKLGMQLRRLAAFDVFPAAPDGHVLMHKIEKVVTYLLALSLESSSRY